MQSASKVLSLFMRASSERLSIFATPKGTVQTLGWNSLLEFGRDNGVRLMEPKRYDHEILLLQGGGALGAYQAGVYEGLVEAGVAPTWVVGISIGAINASLIVGNPPERRIERLRKRLNRCRCVREGIEPLHRAKASLSGDCTLR